VGSRGPGVPADQAACRRGTKKVPLGPLSAPGSGFASAVQAGLELRHRVDQRRNRPSSDQCPFEGCRAGSAGTRASGSPSDASRRQRPARRAAGSAGPAGDLRLEPRPPPGPGRRADLVQRGQRVSPGSSSERIRSGLLLVPGRDVRDRTPERAVRQRPRACAAVSRSAVRTGAGVPPRCPRRPAHALGGPCAPARPTRRTGRWISWSNATVNDCCGFRRA